MALVTENSIEKRSMYAYIFLISSDGLPLCQITGSKSDEEDVPDRRGSHDGTGGRHRGDL